MSLRGASDAPFEEPWQARAFALAEAVVEATGLDREEFRRRLMAAVADDPGRPYWESWLAALERLVADHGLASSEEIEGRLSTTS